MSPQPNEIGRSLIIGTLWLAGWRMFTRALGFVSLISLTQLLIPADFGLVALASAVSTAVDSLSQLGVRDALVRLRDDAEDHFDAAFVIQAGRGLVTGFMLVASSTVAANHLGDTRLQPVFLVLGCLSFIGGLENIGTVTLARRLDFRSQVLLQAGPRVLGVAATILLALCVRSYWALIAGLAFSRTLTTLCSYAVAPHRPKFRLHGWRYLLHFSAWSWAGSVAVLIWSRSDPFIVGPAVGPALLGVYVIAAEVALLPVTELIEPISSALYSGFAMAHRTGTTRRDATLRVAMTIAMCAAPLCVGLSAASGYLAQGLLGPKWSAAQSVISIITLVCVFSPFSYVCGATLSAEGHVQRAFYCNSIAALIKVIMLFFAVYLSRNLIVISLAGVLAVAVEAGLFIWQLKKITLQRLRTIAWPALRTFISGATAAFLMQFAPGTWALVSLPRWQAVVFGTAVLLVASGVQVLIHVALWSAAKHPDGPERDIAGLVARGCVKVATKLASLCSSMRTV